MINDHYVRLTKFELDMMHQDTSNKKYPEDLQIEFFFNGCKKTPSLAPVVNRTNALVPVRKRSVRGFLENTVAHSTRNTKFAHAVRGGFMPLNQSALDIPIPVDRETLEEEINGRTVELMTKDSITLDAVWGSRIFIDSSNKDDTKKVNDQPTVILFHGNSMVLENMYHYALWYYDLDFNVLLLTMRGYGFSSGDAVESGEVGIIYDVECAVEYCLIHQRVKREKLLLHGNIIHNFLVT